MDSFYWKSPIYKPQVERILRACENEIVATGADASGEQTAVCKQRLAAVAIQFRLGCFEEYHPDMREVRARIQTAAQAFGVLAKTFEVTSDSEDELDVGTYASTLVATNCMRHSARQSSNVDLPWILLASRVLSDFLSEIEEGIHVHPGPPIKREIQRYVAKSAIIWRTMTGRWPPKTNNQIDGLNTPFYNWLIRAANEADRDAPPIKISWRQYVSGLRLAEQWGIVDAPSGQDQRDGT